LQRHALAAQSRPSAAFQVRRALSQLLGSVIEVVKSGAAPISAIALF